MGGEKMSAPYVPFYTSDFLGGTSGMTAATKGVYITLLCLMYEEEGPLPQKWDTLARRCGCTLPAFTKAIQDLVDDGKISVLGSGLWSEKCEKHIAQRCERRDSAKAAAEKRWEKVKQNQGMSDANAMPETCQPEPEPEPKKDKSNIEAREIRAILCQSANDAAVTSFIAYRRKQKGKALTVTAATRLASQLTEIFERGGDTADALGMAEERGWLTVQPDWYFKAKGQTHDNRNHHNAGTSQGRANRPDAALEQIARLAGIGPASGYGGR